MPVRVPNIINKKNMTFIYILEKCPLTLNTRRADVFFLINESIYVSYRLLHPQHLGGILSRLTLYRLSFDTLSEYPEPWLQ